MNDGQHQFFDFMLARVKPGKETDLKILLSTSFKTVSEGQADTTFFANFKKSLEQLIEPDALPEVLGAIQHFQSHQ